MENDNKWTMKKVLRLIMDHIPSKISASWLTRNRYYTNQYIVSENMYYVLPDVTEGNISGNDNAL